MSTDVRAAMLALFTSVRDQQRNASATELAQPGSPPEQAERMSHEAWGRVEAIANASPARSQYACAKGCSWCCHQPVLISAGEAITIAAHLRQELTATGQAQAGEALAARARRVGQADWDVTWLRERWPCAFLSREGSCSIHAVRPAVCRGYHSTSRTACEDWYVGDSHRVPIDRVSHMGGNGVLHGMIEAARNVGRDAHLYELHSSVLFALSDPDSAWRWAEGKDPFPGLWRMPLTASPSEPVKPGA